MAPIHSTFPALHPFPPRNPRPFPCPTVCHVSAAPEQAQGTTGPFLSLTQKTAIIIQGPITKPARLLGREAYTHACSRTGAIFKTFNNRYAVALPNQNGATSKEQVQPYRWMPPACPSITPTTPSPGSLGEGGLPRAPRCLACHHTQFFGLP